MMKLPRKRGFVIVFVGFTWIYHILKCWIYLPQNWIQAMTDRSDNHQRIGNPPGKIVTTHKPSTVWWPNTLNLWMFIPQKYGTLSFDPYPKGIWVWVGLKWRSDGDWILLSPMARYWHSHGTDPIEEQKPCAKVIICRNWYLYIWILVESPGVVFLYLFLLRKITPNSHDFGGDWVS